MVVECRVPDPAISILESTAGDPKVVEAVVRAAAVEGGDPIAILEAGKAIHGGREL